MTDYEKAKAMACARCAAKPGDPCINALGNKMWQLHPDRWRALAERKASDRDRDECLEHRRRPGEDAAVGT
jgi:hypothetical protein